MTTITVPRALLEQTLEALEKVNWSAAQDWHEAFDAEIAALRAALEQQAWVCPESPEHRYAKPGHCEDCGKPLVLAHGIKE